MTDNKEKKMSSRKRNVKILKSSNRINDLAISIYLIKRLPVELIQQIMHLLPFSHSETISQGCSGTLSLNPYQFHEPDKETDYLMESVIKADNAAALDGMLRNFKINLHGDWMLMLATNAGSVKSVTRLIQDPRVDPSTGNNYAIQEAAAHCHIEIVKMLLQNPRVDPSARNNDAIQRAAVHGHTEVVKMLLQDPRVDPSAFNNYAIRWAAVHGHTEIVKMLLQDPRVDLNDGDNDAIAEAASEGHTEMISNHFSNADPCKARKD